MSKKRAGQFYRDTVNRDIHKIIGFSIDEQTDEVSSRTIPFSDATMQKIERVEYVRCACIVHGLFFGIQEMKSAHLDTDRFERLPFWQEWFYRWRFRGSRLVVPLRDPLEPSRGLDQKNTY